MICRTPATTTSSLRGEGTPTPTVGGLEQQRQSTWRESMLFDTIARLLARESLSSDAHMACLMSLSRDNRVCIPVNLLLSHPIISSLFMSSEELLRQLRHLVANDLLELDERRGIIFPLMKAKRRTLIIRNPKDDEESYRRFLQERCPLLTDADDDRNPSVVVSDSPIVGISTVRTPYSSDIYITFRTEQLAKDIALWLMNNDYQPGERLQVAIKNESQYSASQLLPSLIDYRYSTEYMLHAGDPAYAAQNEQQLNSMGKRFSAYQTRNNFGYRPGGGGAGGGSPSNWRGRPDGGGGRGVRGNESPTNWRRMPSAWPSKPHNAYNQLSREAYAAPHKRSPPPPMYYYGGNMMAVEKVQPPDDPKEFPPLGMQ